MFPAGSYVTAQRVRRVIAEEFDEAFRRVDVIVTPRVDSGADHRGMQRRHDGDRW